MKKLDLMPTLEAGSSAVDVYTSSDENQDHFIVRDGIAYAGTHLIIDLWGASHLDDIPRMEKAFLEAV